MTISKFAAWRSWAHQINHNLTATLYILLHTSCQKESALIFWKNLPVTFLPSTSSWLQGEESANGLSHHLLIDCLALLPRWIHTSKSPCLVSSQAPYSYPFDLLAEEVSKNEPKKHYIPLKMYYS